MKKILIMGLPGSGKSYLSKHLARTIGGIWLNADDVRKGANDWDFSNEGRLRQANRMRTLAEKYLNQGKNVISDFICPTEETRRVFGADYTIFMNTITVGRFEDTNKIFEPPNHCDFEVNEWNAELFAIQICDQIQAYTWDNKKPTAQMLGRFQPWHAGHQKLFEEILIKTGQVNIMVKDVQGINDNPFDFETVKANISQALKIYKKRIIITMVPNISTICYGRTVGYKIEEIDLDEETKKISATKIRQELRTKGEL